MKRYVIYCRKSTNDPSHQLYSLPAQEKLCKEYALNNDLYVSRIIKEKHSAKDAGKRPLFMKLVEELKAGKYHGIITHKVDRLLRSIGDYAKIDDLRSQGIEFIFVDGSYPNNPDGNMMLGINVVFAKRYVENLSLEVKKGYKEALSQGRFPREAPVGYLDEGRGIKVLDPVHGPMVRQAFEMYSSGNHSLESLLVIMRKKGLRTKRGQKFRQLISKSSLHRILSNPFYHGLMSYNRELHQGQHAPLIDKRLFDKVQSLLNSKSTSYTTRKPYTYRKLIRCLECEGTLSPYTKKGHIYYGCTRKGCPETTTRESAIEERVKDIIGSFSFSENDLEIARIAMIDIEKKINKDRNHNLKILRKRAKECISQQDRIRELLIKGTLQDKEYVKERNRLHKLMQDIKIEKDAYIKVEAKRLDDIYDFLELSQNASLYFQHGNIKEKREITQLVFLELKVKSKEVAYYKLKPEFKVLENRASQYKSLHGGIHGTILELFKVGESVGKINFNKFPFAN